MNDEPQKTIESVSSTRDQMNALDALQEMVAQHCAQPDGTLDSMALSANTDAMRILEQYGKLIITSALGRRVIGRWNDQHE